jgi:hypothetical protein
VLALFDHDWYICLSNIYAPIKKYKQYNKGNRIFIFGGFNSKGFINAKFDVLDIEAKDKYAKDHSKRFYNYFEKPCKSKTARGGIHFTPDVMKGLLQYSEQTPQSPK